MIKKCVLVLCLLLNASLIMAKRAEVTKVEQIITVAVSTFSWTALPPIASINDNRIGIMIDMADGVTDYMLILPSTSTVAPGVGITVGFKMKESDPPWRLGYSPGVYLWGIMMGDGPQNIFIQQDE